MQATLSAGVLILWWGGAAVLRGGAAAGGLTIGRLITFQLYCPRPPGAVKRP